MNVQQERLPKNLNKEELELWEVGILSPCSSFKKTFFSLAFSVSFSSSSSSLSLSLSLAELTSSADFDGFLSEDSLGVFFFLLGVYK